MKIPGIKMISISRSLLARWRMAKKGPVNLVYHVISDTPLYHVMNLYSYKSIEMFEADIRYLKQNYNVISYFQLLERSFSKNRGNPNEAFLSFDDGYSECFSIVRPILLKYKLPCAFFIATDFIDNKNMFYRNKISLCIEKIKSIARPELLFFFDIINRELEKPIQNLDSFIRWVKSLSLFDINTIEKICCALGLDTEQYLKVFKPYLTSEEIKCLANDGFTIGAHSMGHPDFKLLNNRTIEEEITGSCKVIMNITGAKQIPFALPFSGKGINRDFLEKLTSKYKFLGLFFKTAGQQGYNDFIINRTMVDSPALSRKDSSNLAHLLSI